MCVLHRIHYVEECFELRASVLSYPRGDALRHAFICTSRHPLVDNSQQHRYEIVRRRRAVCQPNVGFAAQLIGWSKRRTSIQCARKIVQREVKLLTYVTHRIMENVDLYLKPTFKPLLYQVRPGHQACLQWVSDLCYCPSRRNRLSPSSWHMDSPSAFVIVSQSFVFAWIGERCPHLARNCASRRAQFIHMSSLHQFGLWVLFSWDNRKKKILQV